MKSYLLIGKATNGCIVPRKVEDPHKCKSIIKDFINNNQIKSAVLVEMSSEKTRIQLLKGDLEEFKEAFDKECPRWEAVGDIINLAA